MLNFDYWKKAGKSESKSRKKCQVVKTFKE